MCSRSLGYAVSRPDFSRTGGLLLSWNRKCEKHLDGWLVVARGIRAIQDAMPNQPLQDFEPCVVNEDPHEAVLTSCPKNEMRIRGTRVHSKKGARHLSVQVILRISDVRHER
jgi:hypothetical protein